MLGFLIPPWVRWAALGAALVAGWGARTVYDGYLANEAQKDAIVEHDKGVVADETAGLTFGLALNDIAAATTSGLSEIHHADLKPTPQIIYVDRPGEVVCPVRSQWTPDAVRLFNDPGSAAEAPAADGSVHPVR